MGFLSSLFRISRLFISTAILCFFFLSLCFLFCLSFCFPPHFLLQLLVIKPDKQKVDGCEHNCQKNIAPKLIEQFQCVLPEIDLNFFMVGRSTSCIQHFLSFQLLLRFYDQYVVNIPAEEYQREESEDDYLGSKYPADQCLFLNHILLQIHQIFFFSIILHLFEAIRAICGLLS